MLDDTRQMITEPDLDKIGEIVDLHGDTNSEAWSRYHETRRGALTMRFWKNHFEWQFLAHRYPPCLLLDYGCGTAHSDVCLADAGFAVIGYEPNKTNREVAEYVVSVQEKNIRDRILIVDMIPKRDWIHLIDLVWISHVFEHIPKIDWPDFFRPIILGQWKTLIAAPLGHAHEVPSHVNFWNNERELVVDLESVGFTVMWSGTDVVNNVIRVEVKS